MIERGPRLVIFNGSTGGVGRHMPAAARTAGLMAHPLNARLEDGVGLAAELDALPEAPIVYLVQLAGRVSVPACEADPEGTRELNVVRASAVLDRVLDWAFRRSVALGVVYVSTGHVYAATPEQTRVGEDAPLGPRSVYARTKLEAEDAFRVRASRAGVPLMIARVFGLLAPGQPSNYVLPGLINRVRVGDLANIPGLDMSRDYLDARDVCRNLLALAVSSVDGSLVANVCSGEPTTIRELLAKVLEAAGEPDPLERASAATAAAGRPDDVPWLVGDPSRFVRLTGLAPRTRSLLATARDAFAATG